LDGEADSSRWQDGKDPIGLGPDHGAGGTIGRVMVRRGETVQQDLQAGSRKTGVACSRSDRSRSLWLSHKPLADTECWLARRLWLHVERNERQLKSTLGELRCQRSHPNIAKVKNFKLSVAQYATASHWQIWLWKNLAGWPFKFFPLNSFSSSVLFARCKTRSLPRTRSSNFGEEDSLPSCGCPICIIWHPYEFWAYFFEPKTFQRRGLAIPLLALVRGIIQSIV
jgi:hypothetical protein